MSSSPCGAYFEQERWQNVKYKDGSYIKVCCEFALDFPCQILLQNVFVLIREPSLGAQIVVVFEYAIEGRSIEKSRQLMLALEDEPALPWFHLQFRQSLPFDAFDEAALGVQLLLLQFLEGSLQPNERKQNRIFKHFFRNRMAGID